MKGCLEYGNRGDTTTTAVFFGTVADQSAISDEVARGCRSVAVSASGSDPGGFSSAVEKIILQIRNFFPSDVKHPQETMLQIQGEVGVLPQGPEEYVSFFNYVLKQVDGSPNGKTTNMSLRPAFRGATESLLPFFHQKYPDGVKMGAEGDVSFEAHPVVPG
jgi:hypothetical protein